MSRIVSGSLVLKNPSQFDLLASAGSIFRAPHEFVSFSLGVPHSKLIEVPRPFSFESWQEFRKTISRGKIGSCYISEDRQPLFSSSCWGEKEKEFVRIWSLQILNTYATRPIWQAYYLSPLPIADTCSSKQRQSHY